MANRTTVDPEQLADTSKLEESLVLLLQNIKKYVIPAVILIVVLMVVAMVMSKQKAASQAASAEAFGQLSKAMDIDLPQDATPDQEKAAYTERLNKLDEVAANYPSSPVAMQAAFYKANTYYKLEEYDKAVDAFKAFTTTYPSAKPYTALAYMGTANAQTELGDLEGALESFIGITKLSADNAEVAILAQAKYRASICAAVLGKKDQARSLLEEILASPADAFMKQRAQSALDDLEIMPASDLLKSDEEAAKEDQKQSDGSGLSIKAPPGLQISPVSPQ